MPEIVTDGATPQMPLPAAEETYGRQTNPGLGRFVLGTLQDAGTAFLGRAAERGTVAGSSSFDQGMAALTATGGAFDQPLISVPQPTSSPEMPPEQYNDLYAPRDTNGKVVPIGDKPMPEALAKIIGRQKAEAMQRESVLARYAETHSGITSFAVGSLASMLDPLNAGAAFLPALGEGAIAARLGGGLLARTAARVAAGAEMGIAQQLPLSAIKFGLSPEEASDYGLRDAMRDLAYGAAGVAVLHTGIGSIGEALGRARARGTAAATEIAPGAEVSTSAPADAAAILSADAVTKNAAMRGALGEISDGRPVDVAPIIRGNSPEAAPALARIDELTADRLAAERGERAAGSPARSFSAIAAGEQPTLIGEPVSGIVAHRVATATGESVDVRPVVVEARDLLASSDRGYDTSLQPRERTRAAAEQQVREMASRLEPERLGFSAEADRGAPIVGPDRMIESGNGRVMAIRQAYAQGTVAAERYRRWLQSQGVDVSRYQEPVLVRQRTTPLTGEQRQSFAIAANRPATLALSAPERALADARAITSDMLELIRNPDELGAVGNREFVRSFVDKLPQAEQGTLTTATGDLSAEGLARVRNAVLARAYGGDEQSARLMARIAEATNDEVKSISNSLTAAAPLWARLRADIESGLVRRDLDLTRDLLEAVQRTADLRAKGTKLADYLAQQDAFDQLKKPVEAWMRMFYDGSGKRAASAVRIAEALKTYATEARKVSAEQGLDLGLAPVTAEQLQRFAGGGAVQQHGLFGGGGSGNGSSSAGGRGEIQRPSTLESRTGTGTEGAGNARQRRPATAPAELTQQELAREGWAPSVSRDELAIANDAVYGKKAEAPSETQTVDADLAAAEERLAAMPPDSLLPEDRASLSAAVTVVEKAEAEKPAFDAAASCLRGLF